MVRRVLVCSAVVLLLAWVGFHTATAQGIGEWCSRNCTTPSSHCNASNRCACNSTFTPFSRFFCGRGVNDPCPSGRCDAANTTCYAGRCSCRPYTIQNVNRTACVSNSGAGGGGGGVHQRCTSDYDCSRYYQNGVCISGVCGCRPGYALVGTQCQPIVTPGGGGHISCHYNVDCFRYFKDGVCNNGVCGCRPGYTPVGNTCQQLINPGGGGFSGGGGFAGGGGSGGSGGGGGRLKGCQQNADCYGIYQDAVCNNGQCGCRPGYIGVGMKCYEMVNKLEDKCSPATQWCYMTRDKDRQHVDCHKGKCKCMKGYKASKDKRSCNSATSIGSAISLIALLVLASTVMI